MGLDDGVELDGDSFVRADEFLEREAFVNLGDSLVCDFWNWEVRRPKGVCSKCYGELAELNEYYHTGILAVLLLTNSFTQMLLSSKHLLKTQSEVISWPEGFSEVFHADRTDVRCNLAVDGLEIDKDDVQEDDEGRPYVKTFRIIRKKDRTTINSPKELYLEGTLLDRAQSAGQGGSAVVKGLKAGDSVFRIYPDNTELSSSLKAMQRLLESNDHNGMGDDWRAVHGEFVNLLEENGLDLQSVHAEMILRGLVRSAEDPSKLPDWLAEEEPAARVLTVKSAVLESPHLADSLAFEQIKRQMVNPRTFSKRGTSIIDPLFV